MNQTLPPTGIFDFHTFNETILEKVGSQAGNLSKSDIKEKIQFEG
jgi:hypothetical protein